MKKKLVSLIVATMTTLAMAMPVGASTIVDRSRVIVSTDVTMDVKTAVWSDTNGQDDLIWYDNIPTPVGYNCDFDARNHKHTGLFHAHTYLFMNGNPILINTEKFNVGNQLNDPEFMVHVGKNNIDVVARNYYAFDKLVVAVWSAKDDQDDLAWYWIDSNGLATIPTSKHLDGSKVYIHLYGFNSEGQGFLDEITI